MRARPLVAVSQPYVPAYRVPLFSAIRERLATDGVDFLVGAGDPSGAQAARADGTRPNWRVDMRSRSLRFGSREVALRRFPRPIHPDVVVSELEALNTLAWSTLPTSRKLVLWGHGKPYVNQTGALSDRIEWALAKRADAVMTYAEGGRRYLVDRGGLNSQKVTAIGNSTDSAALRAAFESINETRQRQLEVEWPRAIRALFVGGLDASKRIDFLVEAALAARAVQPDFTLIVVGRGALEAELRKAGPAVVHIPVARGESLAELSWGVQAIWMPGRIGLVAVDALALGLPVLTTDYPFHAPEVEFLREGEIEVLPNSAAEFASVALGMMSGQLGHVRKLRDDIPSIDAVADRFVNVIRGVL